MDFPRDIIRSLTLMNIINPRHFRYLSIKFTGTPAFLGLTLSLDTPAFIVKAFRVARSTRPGQSSLQFPFVKPCLPGLFEALLIREPY
jgi:hypothetical protein